MKSFGTPAHYGFPLLFQTLPTQVPIESSYFQALFQIHTTMCVSSNLPWPFLSSRQHYYFSGIHLSFYYNHNLSIEDTGLASQKGKLPLSMQETVTGNTLPSKHVSAVGIWSGRTVLDFAYPDRKIKFKENWAIIHIVFMWNHQDGSQTTSRLMKTNLSICMATSQQPFLACALKTHQFKVNKLLLK